MRWIENASIRNNTGNYAIESNEDGSVLTTPYGPGEGRTVSRNPYHEVAGDVVPLGDSPYWTPVFRHLNDDAGSLFLGIIYYTHQQIGAADLSRAK